MVVSFLVMSFIFQKQGSPAFFGFSHSRCRQKTKPQMLCEAFTAATVLQSGKPVITLGGINSLPTSIALHIRDSPADVLRRTSGKRHRNRFHFGGIPFRALRLPVPMRTRYFCQPRLYLPDLAIGRLKLLALPYSHAGKMSIPNFPLLQILRIFLHGRMGSCEILPQLSCMNIGYDTAECKKGAGA